MDEEQREEIWDDGLHFTETGYEIMGEQAGRRLIDILVVEEKEKEGK